jgi:quercetin dioxygenase-like cupin family protein
MVLAMEKYTCGLSIHFNQLENLEERMDCFKDYRDFVGSRPEKFFKSTLFESGRLMLGLNCLEPGQEQAVHAHDGQDKFYFVLEGEGVFTVGEVVQTAGEGMTVWAPEGVDHGVRNAGDTRLVVLMGMAPAPGH